MIFGSTYLMLYVFPYLLIFFFVNNNKTVLFKFDGATCFSTRSDVVTSDLVGKNPLQFALYVATFASFRPDGPGYFSIFPATVKYSRTYEHH